MSEPISQSIIILSGSFRLPPSGDGINYIKELIPLAAIFLSGLTTWWGISSNKKLSKSKELHEKEILALNLKHEELSKFQNDKVECGKKLISAMVELDRANNLAHVFNDKENWLIAIQAAFCVMQEIKHFQVYLRSFEEVQHNKDKFTSERDYFERYYWSLRYYILNKKALHLIEDSTVPILGVNNRQISQKEIAEQTKNQAEQSIEMGMRGAINVIRQELKNEPFNPEIPPKFLETPTFTFT